MRRPAAPAAYAQERRESARVRAEAIPQLEASLHRGARVEDLAPPASGGRFGTVAIGLSCLALLAVWPRR